MALSDVLKKRRSDLGLTLLEIANRMGVSEATVQRWESGNIKSLRHGRLTQLAEILQVPPAELMGWDNSNDYGFSEKTIEIAKSFEQLDDADQNYVRGVIDCCLNADKYKQKKADVS